MAVVLVCLGRRDAKEEVDKMFFNLSISRKIDLLNFVNQCQIEYQRFFYRKDTKDKLLKDIHGLFQLILHFLTERSMLELDKEMRIIGRVPSWFSAIMKKRLFICSLHENQQDVKSVLIKLRDIPIDYIQYYPKKRLLTTRVFFELCFYIPRRVSNASFLKEYNKMIWNAHSSTPVELRYYENSYIYNDYSELELMQQIFCLQLENWKQIWTEMHWPTTFEVQKRLLSLKAKQWHPPVKDYLDYMLSSSV